MKIFKNEIKIPYWICGYCQRQYRYDNAGKESAERCCICSKCGIINKDYNLFKKDFYCGICEKCNLKSEISNIKNIIERQQKLLMENERKLVVLECHESKRLKKETSKESDESDQK